MGNDSPDFKKTGIERQAYPQFRNCPTWNSQLSKAKHIYLIHSSYQPTGGWCMNRIENTCGIGCIGALPRGKMFKKSFLHGNTHISILFLRKEVTMEVLGGYVVHKKRALTVINDHEQWLNPLPLFLGQLVNNGDSSLHWHCFRGNVGVRSFYSATHEWETQANGYWGYFKLITPLG